MDTNHSKSILATIVHEKLGLPSKSFGSNPAPCIVTHTRYLVNTNASLDTEKLDFQGWTIFIKNLERARKLK